MAQYKVKSDYTILRKNHKLLEKGRVYENDYMTISPMDELFAPDQQIIPSSHNFKFSVRLGYNEKKKHARHSWLTNGSGDTWTLDNMSGTSISDESVIRIKPDYSSLRDFAYYGSAAKMVQAAVNDVILNFPAEIYFSVDKFPIDTNYYLIHNGYGIDAHTPRVTSTIDNPIRVLSMSNGNYDYYEGGEFKASGVTFTVTPQDLSGCDGIIATCVASCGDATMTFYTYQSGKDMWLIYDNGSLIGKSIRPCQEIIDNFFNEIDDFEYVLLNRNSKPIYRATFETPYETDSGNFYMMQEYVWPSYNNWNPDVDSGAYSKFIGDLVSLAQWHDEYDSNNMWRMETHEAIKNLDWTFFKDDGQSIDDMSNIDSSKIEAMIQIYGRVFDGIKRYTDNIKAANNVTYNEKNNLPDYHLTDVAELAGWDVYSIKPIARTDIYSDNFYSGRTKGWNEAEANISFVRNLKINSNYIQSLKGTRDGLQTLLGLLGLKREEYDIQEYVSIFEGKGSGCDGDTYAMFELNENDYEENELDVDAAAAYTTMPLYRNVMAINAIKDESNLLDDYTLAQSLTGLALRVNRYDEEDKHFYYCTPWFDRNVAHDGNWYFQCNGGWERKEDKKINFPDLTSATTLTESDELHIYGESEGYLKFAVDFEEMLKFPVGMIEEGDICYVTDIGGLQGYYSGTSEMQDLVEADMKEFDDASHYYILRNKDVSSLMGLGWDYIPLVDIRAKELSTPEAKKVVYLETLKEKTEGNNPHNGFGKYDDGQEYIDRMMNIFQDSLENDKFSSVTDTDKEAISKYTFTSNKVADNKKCWFFSDMAYAYNPDAEKTEGKLVQIVDGSEVDMEIANADFSSENIGYLSDTEHTTISPISALVNKDEESKAYSEAAADSVINLKNVEITFHYPNGLSDEYQKMWKDYVEDIVLEYVSQMLPSTTIWKYKWA